MKRIVTIKVAKGKPKGSGKPEYQGSSSSTACTRALVKNVLKDVGACMVVRQGSLSG